jgi:myo-inositol-1(or 4)-monophosphatase
MLNALASHAQKARVLGSAALDLCKVACGQADGYYENGIFPWDMAAGTLLVERAGGRSEILRRGPDRRLMVLATNGRIHEEARSLIGQTVLARNP